MNVFQLGVDNTTEINRNEKYKLFVEGSNNQELDAVVLQELLNNNELDIQVQTMGACDNVRSAAQALIKHHPNYYFLIDRDNQDQTAVDDSWNKFPDPNVYNMLVWHKRELENYFIDPEYLAKSSYLKPETKSKPAIDIEELKSRILTEANRRLFMDAANLTLAKLKKELREIPITATVFTEFKDNALFDKKTDGWLQLAQRSNILDTTIQTTQTQFLAKNKIENIYNDFVQELSGGLHPLQYGTGAWLERMSGKEIFRTITSQCFEVLDSSNKALKGKQQNNEIAKELMRLPLNQQPSDFQKLVEILKIRLVK